MNVHRMSLATVPLAALVQLFSFTDRASKC